MSISSWASLSAGSLPARCLKASELGSSLPFLAGMVSLTFCIQISTSSQPAFGVSQNLSPTCPAAPRVCNEPHAGSLGPLLFLIQSSLYTIGECHLSVYIYRWHCVIPCSESLSAISYGTWGVIQLSWPERPCLVIPVTSLVTVHSPRLTNLQHLGPFCSNTPASFLTLGLCKLAFPSAWKVLPHSSEWLARSDFTFQLRCYVKREAFLILLFQPKVLSPTSQFSLCTLFMFFVALLLFV